MERNIEVGKIYRHFKGRQVKVLLIGTNTETMEDMVVYKHNNDNKIWIRPYDMFNSLLDKEKYPNVNQVYRFEEVKIDC